MGEHNHLNAKQKPEKAGEFSLIESIKQRFASKRSDVHLGIGDDAAWVASPPNGMLVTVDMLMEGVHFDLSYFEPEEVGHKAFAVNLSDIAAMGGKPLYAVASLGIPDRLGPDFLNRLFDGFSALMARYETSLIGGNLTLSPHSFVADLTLMGTPYARPFTRSGAKPGNRVAVTGTLGKAAAGFRLLKELGRKALDANSELALAQLRPEPRLREAKRLAEWGGVTSAMDISDGVASELGHLATASSVGFRVKEDGFPIAEAVERFAESKKVSALELALHGGEDYELLFTFDAAKGTPPIPHFVLGEVVAERSITWVGRDGKTSPLLTKGWDHFRSK